MAVQGEELASKIEERIKQAIDSVVEDIRVSIDDVREVVNQQFDAVLQSVLADAKSMSVRAELDEMLAGQTIPEPSAAQPAAPKGPTPRELKKAVQRIERGGTQVDVLNGLLDQLLEFGSRAALLILKGDTFSGWKGKGFPSFGGSDETVKRFSAGPGEIGELDRLRLDERVVAWDGASFAQKLAVTPPQNAVVVPMVIKDKISAAVYVDLMPERDESLDQAAVELLVFVTGLLIDTLAIRRKVPSPTLSRETDAEPFESEAEPQVLATEEPSRPAPAPRPTAPPKVAEAPEMPPTRVPELEMEAPEPAYAPPPAPERPAPPPPTTVSPPQQPTPRPLETAPEPRPAPPPAPRPPAAPPSASAGTQVKPPTGSGDSTQYVPPPGVKGGFAARAEMGEDAKKHDDARRFARLLVSEIKLYNEGKVDQGRKNGDLYERLKEDIDRSRQMYEDRVPEEVRESSNYFYDELVRILADGNADALGL